jgi:hypothetical protein
MILGVSEMLSIEEHPTDPGLDELFERAAQNLRWFERHAAELGL